MNSFLETTTDKNQVIIRECLLAHYLSQEYPFTPVAEGTLKSIISTN
jgi:hypothetical protein